MSGPLEALGPWFHNLHLPDGTQTAPEHPLGDYPSYKWQLLAPALPADLDGWTALDIGCNAGFYSFELARRGAQVTAIDSDERYLAQARWAAAEYGLEDQIRWRQMQVYELAGSDGHVLDRDPMLQPGWPRMAFIEKSWAGDPTNWWVPNRAAVEAVLRSSGLCVRARPADEMYVCEPDPEHPSCVTTWDAAEFLAATGRDSSGGQVKRHAGHHHAAERT